MVGHDHRQGLFPPEILCVRTCEVKLFKVKLSGFCFSKQELVCLFSVGMEGRDFTPLSSVGLEQQCLQLLEGLAGGGSGY